LLATAFGTVAVQKSDFAELGRRLFEILNGGTAFENKQRTNPA
jgi:hypothetical protein